MMDLTTNREHRLELVGVVHNQQVANGRRSRKCVEFFSDFVIERRRIAPTWSLDSVCLNAACAPVPGMSPFL